MPPTAGQREDWLAANFLELRKAEVQLLRIHLPRTPVNSLASDLYALPRRRPQAGLIGARALSITRSAVGAKASRMS